MLNSIIRQKNIVTHPLIYFFSGIRFFRLQTSLASESRCVPCVVSMFLLPCHSMRRPDTSTTKWHHLIHPLQQLASWRQPFSWLHPMNTFSPCPKFWGEMFFPSLHVERGFRSGSFGLIAIVRVQAHSNSFRLAWFHFYLLRNQTSNCDIPNASNLQIISDVMCSLLPWFLKPLLMSSKVTSSMPCLSSGW